MVGTSALEAAMRFTAREGLAMVISTLPLPAAPSAVGVLRRSTWIAPPARRAISAEAVALGVPLSVLTLASVALLVVAL